MNQADIHDLLERHQRTPGDHDLALTLSQRLRRHGDDAAAWRVLRRALGAIESDAPEALSLTRALLPLTRPEGASDALAPVLRVKCASAAGGRALKEARWLERAPSRLLVTWRGERNDEGIDEVSWLGEEAPISRYRGGVFHILSSDESGIWLRDHDNDVMYWSRGRSLRTLSACMCVCDAREKEPGWLLGFGNGTIHHQSRRSEHLIERQLWSPVELRGHPIYRIARQPGTGAVTVLHHLAGLMRWEDLDNTASVQIEDARWMNARGRLSSTGHRALSYDPWTDSAPDRGPLLAILEFSSSRSPREWTIPVFETLVAWWVDDALRRFAGISAEGELNIIDLDEGSSLWRGVVEGLTSVHFDVRSERVLCAHTDGTLTLLL